MEETVSLQLKEIKRSFRLMMNGVTAQSMRDKGSDYHVNWGASLPMLKEKAKEIGKNYDLAIALWKENVRECKILATMVMPAEEILPEVADIWMEQMPSLEIAELSSFNLFQQLPYANVKAFEWIATDKQLYQICGFHVLSRLFQKGYMPDSRDVNEYIDQLQVAISSGNSLVAKAAVQSAMRFADINDDCEIVVKNALKQLNLELFNQ